MQRTVRYHVDADEDSVTRKEFYDSLGSDSFCERQDFALLLKPEDFIYTCLQAIKKCGIEPTCHVAMDDPGNLVIHVKDRAPGLVQINISGAGLYSEERRHNFQVWLTGTRDFITTVFAELRAVYGEARIATVAWWYKAAHGITNRTIPIEEPLPIYDELYPFIEGGVDAYIKSYLKDRASILFMMGPPGTGKTSLLRHAIFVHRLAASITYDEDVFGKDEMFINFLCDSEDSMLIIEDADMIVGSRESAANKLMSRFLNVGDGLIKMTGKKIIFTTNLGDFHRVDPALVRPGRCYDAIKFRPLTYNEACIAAERVGVAVPKEKKEYTLGQLFGHESEASHLAESGF